MLKKYLSLEAFAPTDNTNENKPSWSQYINNFISLFGPFSNKEHATHIYLTRILKQPPKLFNLYKHLRFKILFEV